MKIVPKNNGSDVGSFYEITSLYLEDNSWRDEINEFADIIIRNKCVDNGNSSDALKVMEMVYGIYYADESWQKAFNIQI